MVGWESIWTFVEHLESLFGQGWLGMSLFGSVVLPLKRELSNVGRSWHAWISPRGYGQTCSFLLIYSYQGGGKWGKKSPLAPESVPVLNSKTPRGGFALSRRGAATSIT
jgi:hypothetical protein